MKKFNSNAIENAIGYRFSKKGILKQAFTRKSYTVETEQGENNEVLEFLGDKVLDLVVTKRLIEQTTQIDDTSDIDLLIDPTLDAQEARLVCYMDESRLSQARAELVNKKSLACCIEALGLQEYLIMSKSDIMQETQNEDSVKEDLFEAIIGAVAIDCQWNMATVTDVVDIMLNLDERVYDGYIYESYNFKQMIQAWCQRRYKCLPEYRYYSPADLISYPNKELLEDIEKIKPLGFTCRVVLPSVDNKIYGYGKSKAKASLDAAKKAYVYLQKNGMLINLKDIIGEPCIEKAINQLQELYQKKYISKPEYNAYDEIDNDGSSIWYSECKIECIGELRFGTYQCHDYNTGSSTKVEAKKRAAYEVLCWLFKCLNIEIESLKQSKNPDFYSIDQEIEYEDSDYDPYDFDED
ncbi:MAG: hypothetical protein II984_08250 [Clostridia bacterium]|nr:hypothetical protein [Clostridia bacterium]